MQTDKTVSKVLERFIYSGNHSKLRTRFPVRMLTLPFIQDGPSRLRNEYDGYHEAGSDQVVIELHTSFPCLE